MKPQINLTDPTYLRYIYDGLSFNTLHKDNISALPEGLIGVYEEALSSDQNINTRERFLTFFAACTLLKKEVSTSFMADLLDWEEWEVIDFLSDFTKWFISPTPGSYILYHERLRIFFLQKITTYQLNRSNHSIISKCQIALEQRKGDEWEIYALEHLPSHLLIPSMQQEQDGAEYRKLVNDTGFWNRQVEISKGYDWTKKMLNQSMGWAAKQSTDELIECALNKIDLHYMEQNDAPRIVEMVAQNDIETALLRIEAFGGNDKEGLQRKLTLYMLCLMELTLLDSKDKPFRINAIEKLLNHFDENIPVDHSLLNWNDFFPSYVMFLMACEWLEIGVDYMRVYRRTTKWEADWIKEKGTFNHHQFNVMLECARNLNDYEEKSNILKVISTEIANQHMDEKWASVLLEMLACARGISQGLVKSRLLSDISAEMTKQGKLEEGASILKEALECAYGINNESTKDIALNEVSAELAKQNRLEEALECALSISDERFKSSALGAASTELSKCGKLIEAMSVMQKAIDCARHISDYYSKSIALSVLSTELAKQGMTKDAATIIQEAIVFTHDINIGWEKIVAQIEISEEMVKQGKFHEALEYAENLLVHYEISGLLKKISIQLSKNGMIKEALSLSDRLKIKCEKCEVLIEISSDLFKNGQLAIASTVVENAIECALRVDNFSNIKVLRNISSLVAEYGDIEKAANLMKQTLNSSSVVNYEDKNSLLSVISLELYKVGQSSEAYTCANKISDEWQKVVVLACISTELSKQNKLEEASLLMDEAFVIARKIGNIFYMSRAISRISIELANQDHLNKALICTNEIINFTDKDKALIGISNVLAKKGKIDYAIDCARSISNDHDRSLALNAISTILAKLGKIDAALECASGIKDYYWKSSVLTDIFVELVIQRKLEKASSLIKEAIESSRCIIGERQKSNRLIAISKELAKQGKVEEKESLLQESLECARGIIDESEKSFALEYISTELSELGDFNFIEEIGIEIPKSAIRYMSWQKIAETQKNQKGWEFALKKCYEFHSHEAQTFYLKGWAESISVEDISTELAYKAIHALMNDSASLEHFLQVYAQHELFFNNPSQEKIDRLNKTLNLQWALDIIAQFPKQ